MWNDAAIDDQLDLFVSTIGQIRKRPDSVDQNIHIRVVNEVTKCWKDLIDGLNGWRRVLVATQVDNDPSDVAEEADRDIRLDKREQRRNDTHFDDIISQLRTISDDVSKGPHSLFTNVCGWREQETNEKWNGAGVDDLEISL